MMQFIGYEQMHRSSLNSFIVNRNNGFVCYFSLTRNVHANLVATVEVSVDIQWANVLNTSLLTDELFRLNLGVSKSESETENRLDVNTRSTRSNRKSLEICTSSTNGLCPEFPDAIPRHILPNKNWIFQHTNCFVCFSLVTEPFIAIRNAVVSPLKPQFNRLSVVKCNWSWDTLWK